MDVDGPQATRLIEFLREHGTVIDGTLNLEEDRSTLLPDGSDPVFGPAPDWLPPIARRGYTVTPTPSQTAALRRQPFRIEAACHTVVTANKLSGRKSSRPSASRSSSATAVGYCSGDGAMLRLTRPHDHVIAAARREGHSAGTGRWRCSGAPLPDWSREIVAMAARGSWLRTTRSSSSSQTETASR